VDLDESFGAQASLNYWAEAIGRPQQPDPDNLCKLDEVMLKARAGLCGCGQRGWLSSHSHNLAVTTYPAAPHPLAKGAALCCC
jgi:hypothetical protein